MKKFDNYTSNLCVLSQAKNEDLNNEFILSGIINKFALQFELGWKVLKELLKYEGSSAANTDSPREIIKNAYTIYDFLDEQIWLSMLRSRNDLAHIYDGTAAERLVVKILNEYIPEFLKLQKEIEERYHNILNTL